VANGIVNVSGKDFASGNEQKITITASSGLSTAEVDRLVKESKSRAAPHLDDSVPVNRSIDNREIPDGNSN
jgi:molecular chaperone DnaK